MLEKIDDRNRRCRNYQIIKPHAQSAVYSWCCRELRGEEWMYLGDGEYVFFNDETACYFYLVWIETDAIIGA